MNAFNRRQALALVGAAAGAVMLPARAEANELRIGYQKSSVNLMVVRERKLLEARLPGVQTKWVEFPAGPQILEALAVGSLDFGFTGDPPTHPDLLDWLTVEFVRQGWSMKALHRLIVTSATYQQSSRVTAELLARYLATRLREELKTRHRFEPDVVRMEVEESFGQIARYEWRA